MCGLPSRTIGAQSFIAGPSGYVRDKVFGRGTSQKLVDLADKAHRKTVGLVGLEGDRLDKLGFLPGFMPGPNAKSGEIDFAAEKKKKRFDAAEAERDRVFKSLGQTNAPQSTILGG